MKNIKKTLKLKSYIIIIIILQLIWL